jgi:predicted  nucleic acid-binding Zn-ribbon protein
MSWFNSYPPITPEASAQASPEVSPDEDAKSMAFRCAIAPNNHSFQFDPIYGQYKHQCNILGYYSKNCRYDFEEVREIFDRFRAKTRFQSIKEDREEELLDNLKQLNSTQRNVLDLQTSIRSDLQKALGNTVVIRADAQALGQGDANGVQRELPILELVKQLKITAISSLKTDEALVELKNEVKKLREENRLCLNELKKMRVESADEVKQLRTEITGLRNDLREVSTSFATSLGSSLSESHYSFFESQFPAILKNAFVEALNESKKHASN